MSDRFLLPFMAAVVTYGDTEVVLKMVFISMDPHVPFVYFANLVEEREECWEEKDFSSQEKDSGFQIWSSEHPWTMMMTSTVGEGKKGEKHNLQSERFLKQNYSI